MMRRLALAGAAAVAGCGSGAAGAAPEPPALTVVELQPCDAGAAAVAGRYAPLVQACYGLRVRVATPGAQPGRTTGAAWQHAPALLRALAAVRPPDCVAVVGIGRDPLDDGATPVAKELYGLGETRDRVAVVSLARLGPRAAAAPPAPWDARRARVFLHESGHALGLSHCDDPWCLMHDCTSPEQLDRTALAPCALCWKRFCAVREQDLARRRAALRAAAQPLGLTVPSPEAAR